MANEVGGDFYLFKRLVDGRFLVAICDVSGKGIAASLITAVLGGFFDGYTTSNTMKSFVRRLNRYLYDTFRLEYFITGIIIELDEDTGEATVCDMGHSYMLIMQGAKAPASRFRGRQPPTGGFPQPRSRDPGVPPEAGGRGGSLHGRGDRSDQQQRRGLYRTAPLGPVQILYGEGSPKLEQAFRGPCVLSR